jgi:F0F1-type ATP synthase membrane subunit c/vacuolar-type H+-ATPase subunit K
MALSNDIFRTWRAPRRVVRGLIEQGPREDRLIFVVMVACFLMFIAQLPVMARIAHLSAEAVAADPTREVLERDMLIGTAFFGWMMIMPLMLYLVAGLSVLVLRLVRRPVAGHSARLALFWALLAAAPAALLVGLMNGMVGQGPGTTLVGMVWVAAFLVFWVQGLREGMATPAEQPA